MDEQNVGGQNNSEGGSKGLMWVVGLLVILVIAYGAWRTIKKDSSETGFPTENTATTTPNPTPNPEPSATLYKDGTYSATGNYVSPGGAETIKIELTLKDDVIVDAKVTPQAVRPNSVQFQGIFAANYKPMVIGKKIDEVKLDKVSGSSLAPKGFNDAVAKIKTQAKA